MGQDKFLGKFTALVDEEAGRDGELDKNEFHRGCRDIGIEITRKEINMLFPLIDKNGNGSIDIQELIEFSRGMGAEKISSPRSQSRSLDQRRMKRATLIEDCSNLSKNERKSRIQKKTHLPQLLADLITDLRDALLIKLKQEKISSHELYLLFGESVFSIRIDYILIEIGRAHV